MSKPRRQSQRRHIKPGKLVRVAAEPMRDKAETPPTLEEIRRVMSALGKIGGPKGGRARAASLSAKQRSDIAKRAAVARWSTEYKK